MVKNTRLSKGFLAGLSILTLVISFLFTPFLHKVEASTSWGQEVTASGELYLGKAFNWGGNSPTGFDASGYTQYVFKNSAAELNLPHSSKAQYKLGKAVLQKNLLEGDLVFFKTDRKKVNYVGIYLGNDKFLAVTKSKGVSIQSLHLKYWKDRYVGAKRVLKQYD